MRTRVLALALTCLGAVACEAPPWKVLAAVDSGWLLSVTATSDEVLAAGGRPGSGGQPGEGLLLRLRGTGAAAREEQLRSPVPGMLWWVHGLPGGVAWVAGEGGAVLRYDGGAAPELRAVPAATRATLYGVFAFSDSDVWAVGGDGGQAGVVLHGGAGGLTVDESAPRTGVLYKVFGTDPEHLFVVGEGGVLLRRVGGPGGAGRWLSDDSPVPKNERLFTVHGRGPEEVYAVGGLGTARLLRFDGAAWSTVDTAGLGGLNGVFAGEGGLLLAGGRGLLALGPGAGPFQVFPPPTGLDLHGAFALGEERFAAGGNLAQFGIAAPRGVLLQQGGPPRAPSPM